MSAQSIPLRRAFSPSFSARINAGNPRPVCPSRHFFRDGFFVGLDLVPIRQDLLDGVGFHVAINVRMTADEFLGRIVRNFFEAEARFIFGDRRDEQRLHQEVAELLRDIGIFVRCDRVGGLVGLFDKMARGAGDGLFAIQGHSARSRRTTSRSRAIREVRKYRASCSLQGSARDQQSSVLTDVD